MSDFIQTNTIRDNLRCPKCEKEFSIFRHKAKKIVCPVCSWDQSFHYPDFEEGN